MAPSEATERSKISKKTVARGGTKKIRSIQKKPLAQSSFFAKFMNCNFDFVIDRVQMLFSKPTKKVNLGRPGQSKKVVANNDKKDASAWD